MSSHRGTVTQRGEEEVIERFQSNINFTFSYFFSSVSQWLIHYNYENQL